MENATFLPKAAWQYYLLSYWLTTGISRFSMQLSNTFQELPRGFPIAFGHFLAAFLFPYSHAQQLSTLKSIS
jgi:hypothetical protein